MKKIRVEVSGLATPYTSGVGNYTRLLTEALVEEVYVRGSYYNFLNRQPQPRLSPSVHREENRWFPLRVYAKLASYGVAWPFDLFKKSVDLTIHPNFSTWPTVRSCKVATAVHDLTYLYYPELVEEKNLAHLRRVVPRSIKKADYIITVSHAVKEELIKEFGLESSRCIVTQIPPASEFFRKSDNDIHTIYNIPTKKYILFVGNLEPRKNLSTLIDAYLLLPKKVRQEYSLVIGGGKGWKFEETQGKIDTAVRSGEHVYQVGFVDQGDLPALYQKASLFVMPSKYEGFGMPILEALASHTPVVAADIPVLRESGGSAAVYAEAGDPQSFADQINNSLHTAFDETTARDHLALFSWDKNARNIIERL